MVTGGYEHNYDPTYWNNSSNINNANCYFYALNKRSSSTNLAIQQIGYLSGGQISSLSASNLISLIQADISYMSDIQSIRSSSASETPGYKEYKIALVTSSFDYHFYRQDSTAKWSHKMGHTGISQADNSNYYIYIPSLCNRNYGTGRNYSNFYGYYIVRYN